MAGWDELNVVLVRLRDRQPCPLTLYPGPKADIGWHPPFAIHLEVWATSVAEELHRQFGDIVNLRVGALPYPPGRQPQCLPAPGQPAELLIPDDVVVELDGPAVVRSGHTLHHDLLMHNPTGRNVWVAFGEGNAVVVDPQTGEVVGGYAGATDLALRIRRVPPEQTARVSLLIGTASFMPQLGYALPPGEWGVQGLLRVVPETRGPDRPTHKLPPDAGGHERREPVPPDMRGPDQRTPILPLTITDRWEQTGPMRRNLLCVLGVHRWRRRRNEDGEEYTECSRCGAYNVTAQEGGTLPPGM